MFSPWILELSKVLLKIKSGKLEFFFFFNCVEKIAYLSGTAALQKDIRSTSALYDIDHPVS